MVTSGWMSGRATHRRVDMLRRNFLRAVPTASALALCTWSVGFSLAYANELDAPSRSAWHGMVKDSGARIHAAPSTSAEVQLELQPGDAVEFPQSVAGRQVYPTLIASGHLADGRAYVFRTPLHPPPTPTP